MIDGNHKAPAPAGVPAGRGRVVGKCQRTGMKCEPQAGDLSGRDATLSVLEIYAEISHTKQ